MKEKETTVSTIALKEVSLYIFPRPYFLKFKNKNKGLKQH